MWIEEQKELTIMTRQKMIRPMMLVDGEPPVKA